MDSLSGKLAAFIVGLNYKSLPSEVVQKAKLCLMDTLGAAVAGSKMPEAVIAKRLAEKLSQKKEATLFTGKGKVGALEAALANTASCPTFWSWMMATALLRDTRV